MSNEASEPSSEVQTDISSSPMKNGRGCFSIIAASWATCMIDSMSSLGVTTKQAERHPRPVPAFTSVGELGSEY